MAEKKSPWIYVGIGCGVFALLAVICVVGGGFWVVREVKELDAEMKDPAAREIKVKKLLGAEELPEGYHPMIAFTVPFIMKVAILSGVEGDAEGKIPEEFGGRGFIYIDLIRMGQDQQEIRDYLEGRTDNPRVLAENGINIKTTEIIKRGVLPGAVQGAEMMYVAQRGSVSTQGMDTDGVTSVIMIDCPGDKRGRLAVWFGPDPDPGVDVEQLNLEGTPADESAIAEFMGHFQFCE